MDDLRAESRGNCLFSTFGFYKPRGPLQTHIIIGIIYIYIILFEMLRTERLTPRVDTINSKIYSAKYSEGKKKNTIIICS